MNQTVGLVNMSMRVLMQMVKNQNKTQVFLFLQCNYNLYIYTWVRRLVEYLKCIDYSRGIADDLDYASMPIA